MIFNIELGSCILIGEESNSMHRYLPYCPLVHWAIFMNHEPKGPPKTQLNFWLFFVCAIKDLDLQLLLCRDSCHMHVISIANQWILSLHFYFYHTWFFLICLSLYQNISSMSMVTYSVLLDTIFTVWNSTWYLRDIQLMVEWMNVFMNIFIFCQKFFSF